MPYIVDFDVDEILSSLRAIFDKYPEGSRERDVIELAQIAMIFPRHIRKEDEFSSYYKKFFDPSFEIKVSREFATRDQADEWLASGNAQDAERVKIAGHGFMVVELSKSKRLVFMNAPLPGELEEDENEKVSREFATRDQADEWLASGNAQDAERVKIAGHGFMVVELSKSKRLVFMSLPSPGDLEEDEHEADGD